MEKLKKVFLVKLPNGEVNLIPLEKIIDCEIIVPSEKLGLWVYEKTIPGGAIDGLGDEDKVRNLDFDDIETILEENNGECYVEVDYKNKLSMPSNARGYKAVVLHLNLPEELLPQKMEKRKYPTKSELASAREAIRALQL